LLGVALLVGSAVPGSAAESAAAVAGVSAAIRARDALAYPRVPPVIPAPDATPVEAAPQLDTALIKALQSVDFVQREAAVAKLVQIGPSALPVLRELAQSAEPDAAWWARATIQQIEGSARRPPGAAARPSRDDLLALIAKGPTDETLAALRSLPADAAAELVDLHLRLELGMDCIYSMRPRQILPRALALLPVQTEPFYQAVLLRLSRTVLERVLVALPGTPESADAQEGIRYLAANPAMVATLRPYLAHPIALLRCEASLIMAWGQVDLSPDELRRLLQDPAPDVARQARVLRYGFTAGAVQPADAEAAAWIRECVAALTQDQDRLAQLGAFYAIREAVLDYVGELDQAQAGLPDGRAKDAIVWLLSAEPAGRILLLRRGLTRFSSQPPATLTTILALADYDLRRRGLGQLLSLCRPAALALAWRDLSNDEAGGYTPRRDTSKGRNAGTLELVEPFGLTCKEGTAPRTCTRPERLPDLVEFTPWYDACARTALSTRLGLATGGVRGLLVSDLGGARALVQQYTALIQAAPDPTTAWSFPRDLLLLHPCVGILPPAEVEPTLRHLWQRRGIDKVPNGGGNSNGPKLAGLSLHVPLALWGFVTQNDCSYMNPVGRFLDGQLTLRHLPLLLALLEYNSRSAIFMAALDATEAVPAIRRDVLSRRTNYRLSYDHDLFHGVAHFTILDAMPVLETYTKTNSNWPSNGVMTIAGYENTRYCWDVPFVSGPPSPLAAGALQEFQGHAKAGRCVANRADNVIPAYCEKGLWLMGLTEATPTPAPK
jgi:hypothetical protein